MYVVIKKKHVCFALIFFCLLQALMIFINVNTLNYDVNVNGDMRRNVIQLTEDTTADNRKPQISNSPDTELAALYRSLLRQYPRSPTQLYGYNVSRSDVIPLHRDVTDTRPDLCHAAYYNVSGLPNISVIIPFFNEALSVLLRTVHSILSTTPEEILLEIILVDDHSMYNDVGRPLDIYLATLPKVKVLRNTDREGLIRSRLRGAREARGDVLVFLDAHTECNRQWAEPLLVQIKMNYKIVVQPSVDIIDKDTLLYYSNAVMGDTFRGGIGWDLRYAWFRMPSWIRDGLSSDMDPYPVPVLVGCAIAVRRSYFFDNGAFDRGLDIWGGEHLELSFRTWQCGGSIWTVPCSRVGHLFKETTFNFEGQNKDLIINKNLRRVAEVWLDEYKSLFYAAIRGISKVPELSREEVKSLSERKLLRDSLKCKPFSWYLSTVIPELRFPPEKAVQFGEIRNTETGACFRALPDDHIGLHYDCFVHRILPEHEFHITTDKRLILGESCVDIVPDTLLLRLQSCSAANAFWDIRPGPITGQLVSTNINGTLCVTHVTSMVQSHYNDQMPQAAKCIDGHIYQQWTITYMFNY